MIIPDYITMKNGKYHEANIEYNVTAMKATIRHLFPEDKNPNLDDPKYAHIVQNSLYAPKISGALAQSLGIDKKAFTLELWRDISNGYCPAKHLPANSPLLSKAVDTPRGKMVVLNGNPTPISELGDYDPKAAKKDRAIGTEFLLAMGGNFSQVMARLMTEDPNIEVVFKEIIMEVIEQHLLPCMLFDAKARMGTNGNTIAFAKEILAAAFIHYENRGTEETGVLPFIHVHLDVMNTALGNDGNLYALYAGDICAKKDELTAELQKHVKEKLEDRMGFVFEKVILKEDANNEYLTEEQKNICSYDLPDDWIPEKVRDFYSSRSKEIADATAGRGYLAKEIARVETRDNKSELSPAEMKAHWKKQMDGMGWKASDIIKRLDFNQVRPNNKTISDEQLASNYVRKHQEQEIAKKGPVLYVTPTPSRATDPKDEIDPQVLALLTDIGKKVAQQKLDEQIIDGFLRKHKELCFNEGQFKAHIQKQLLDTHDKDSAQREAARIFEKECVHMIAKDKIEKYRDFIADRITDPHEYQQIQIRFARDMMFTTRKVLAQEKEILDGFKARESETHQAFSTEKAASIILNFEQSMSKEFGKPVRCLEGQRRAMMMCLSAPGAAHTILGRAGSGKSFAARGIKEGFEANGYKTIATAPTNKAAVGLGQDAKFKDYLSLSQLLIDLDKGTRKLDSKTVVIADEMGMACLDDYHRITKHVNDSGAKLISIGEAEQIQSVAHGATFRVLSENFISERITEITRQKSSIHRDMVEDFAMGRSHKAMHTLFDEDRVVITKTEEEKVQSLVKDYLADTKDYKNKFIVAGTNQDVENINNAIRAELKQSGKLSADPADEFTIEDRDGIKRSFVVGDRVQFVKKITTDDTEQQKVFNSEPGTIIKSRTQFNKLTKQDRVVAVQIKMDNGKTIWMSTQRKQPVKHGYAGTIHKSQGSTFDNTYYAPSPHLESLHTAYVACSRHREGIKIYFSDEMTDKMAEKMIDKEPTAQMLKVADWVAATNKIELTDLQRSSFLEVRSFLNDNWHRIDGHEVGKPHPLDDLSSVIEKMASTQFKKSTFDFEILDGKQAMAYTQLKLDRAEMLRNPEKFRVDGPAKVNEPALVKDIVSIDTLKPAPVEKTKLKTKKTKVQELMENGAMISKRQKKAHEIER